MKKLFAILLTAVLFVSLFAGCAKEESAVVVLPKQDVADTVENRQKAIEETAYAFYYKNPYLQYDDAPLSVLGKTPDGARRTSAHMYNTPEMISPDQPVYQVCGGFVYHVMYHCFEVKIMGGWGTAVGWGKTDTMDDFATIQWQDGNGVDGPEAAEWLHNNLQPGDVVSYVRKTSPGHAVLWLGKDVTGDGTMDLINVDGTYYGKSWDNKAAPGVEFREANGGVEINTDNFGKNSPMYQSGEYYLFDPASSQYLGDKMSHFNSWRFTDKIEEYPLTERAKTRVLFPGLIITSQVEDGIFNAVDKGDTITYTLTMENKSEQNHEGILVQIPIPENAKLIAINGESAKGPMVKFTANIGAGDTLVTTYTVQATGEVGSRIVMEGGYVHAIPLPTLTTAIRSGAMDGKAIFDAASANVDKTGMDFVNAVSAAAGKAVNLPELDKLKEAFYDEKRIGEYKVLIPKEVIAEEDKTLAKMAITDFYGGQYVHDGLETTRVKDLRAKDLQAGDILIWEELKGYCDTAIHDGEKFLRVQDGKIVAMTQEDLDRFFTYRYFVAFRPTQAL